ncbi:unnamed protein product [Effrenium voratum]|nr:unnamed protein product [Effrenium voratum]
MALCYLSTFIHVQDEDEPPIAPRARTEPAWSLHERSIDETRCREYIDQLPERLSNWTPPPETSQAQNDDISCKMPGKSSKSAPERPSPGSLGHPEFCSRPCVYVTKGACQNGSSCNFCHLGHGSAPKLDKRQRSMLQDMPNDDVLQLLRACLMTKVKKAKKKGENLPIQSLLHLLDEEMVATNANATTTAAREVQLLHGVLSKMSVAGMLGLANISRFRTEICEGIREELAHLRLRLCRESAEAKLQG